MERTRSAQLFKARTARGAAQGALRGAARNPGVTYAEVGTRLTPPKSGSAIAHDVTDRVHPELHESFRILIGLCGSVDGVSARAYAELALETVDFRELVAERDPEKLIARGCYLWAARHELNSAETKAGELGSPCFPEKSRAEGWAQVELAQIYELLRDIWGIDLHAEYQRRAS